MSYEKSALLVPRPTGGTKLRDLIDDMQEAEVLEDRREYTPADLKSAYDLTDEEADDLYWLVQSHFDPNPVYEVNNIPDDIVKEYIVESLHCTQDGVTEHEWIIIEQFLSDMVLYGKLAQKHKANMKEEEEGAKVLRSEIV